MLVMFLSKFLKSEEWRILWPFYIKSFVLGLTTLMAAFEIIYFQELGLSFFHISILISLIGIVVVITEVPTGAIADIYGRKFSVLTGLTILTLINFAIPFTKSIAFLIFLFGCFGLAMSFVSGAYDAWVVDLLKQNKQESLLQNFMIKNGSFMCAGAILGPLLGSFLATFTPLKYLWAINGIFVAISTLILLFFTTENFEKQKLNILDTIKSLIKNSKEAAKFVYTQKNIFFLTLSSIFLSLAAVGSMGWQPLLIELQMPKSYLGYLYSIAAALGVFVPYFANPISKMFSKKKHMFITLTSINMVVKLLLYFVNAPYFLLACLIDLVITAVALVKSPVQSAFEQKFIPSEKRATIISTMAMIFALTATLSMLFVGKILDIMGPKKTLISFALFAIPAIICYTKLKE